MDFNEIDYKNLDKAIIRQHNDLIEAKYLVPSLQEQRIILMLLSQIKPEDEDFKGYRITVSDFAKMIGTSSKSIYEDMERITRSLRSREIGIRKGKNFFYTGWLSSVEYKHGSGYVELCFDPKLKPYLLQLKAHFTQYRLENVLHFKSVYAIRLYEILKKDAFKGKVILRNRKKCFHVEYKYIFLREIFGIPEKEYAKFADFKRKIIIPAISQISEKTDLNIYDVIYGKTGRAVTRITLEVELLDKSMLNEPENISTPTKNSKELLKDRLVEIGYSPLLAQRALSKYGIRRVERSILYVVQKKSNKINDLPSYLAKVLEADLGGSLVKGLQKKQKTTKKQQHAQKKSEAVTAKNEQKKALALDAAYTKFLTLSVQAQAALKKAFSKTLDVIFLDMMEEISSKGEDAFMNPMIRESFKKFLLEKFDKK